MIKPAVLALPLSLLAVQLVGCATSPSELQRVSDAAAAAQQSANEAKQMAQDALDTANQARSDAADATSAAQTALDASGRATSDAADAKAAAARAEEKASRMFEKAIAK